MRKLGALATALIAALMLAAPAVAAAQAPPQYVDSEPGRGEELHQAPDEVSITFDQPLDPSSTIVVEDHCGRRVDSGETNVSAMEMSVALSVQPAGLYHVEFVAKGIAGVTGENKDSFQFTVHAGPSCKGGGGGGHHHGGGNGGKHNGHGNGSGHGGRHGGGDGGEHGSGTHTTGGHGSTHAGSALSGPHGEHSGAAGGAHGEHGSGHEATEKGTRPTLASGPGGFPALTPTGTAVLTSLALSGLLGLAGGLMLRSMGRPA